MPGKDDVLTAYKNYDLAAPEQKLPGNEADMEPLAEHLKIEMWNEKRKPYLEKYQGSGKLKGMSILGRVPITGGDSGIGRSAALMLAREGADISISYLPEEQEDAEWVRDLMNEELAKKTAKAHVDKYGRIDVLVNNASKRFQEKDFAKIDMETVESTFRSNMLGMFALTKYALPHIPRGGSIINTTSVTAYQGSPAMVDYSSTKGAIVSFTRALAQQLAPKGIRVNGIAPGPIYTLLQPTSRPAEQMEGFEVGETSLRGRAAQPAELDPSYVFLASNRESGTITGQVLHVNLGQWTSS